MVSPAERFEWAAAASIRLPKAVFGDEFANVGDGTFNRLVAQNAASDIGRSSDQEFEVLAVAQGVPQGGRVELRGSFLPGKFVGGRCDRDLVEMEECAAVALSGQARGIEGNAVADIHGRVKVIVFVEHDRFAHARCEVEHVAEDAAAQGPGNEEPVARLAVGASERARTGGNSKRGHADDERPVERVGVAAGDGHVVLGSQRQQAFVDGDGELQRVVRRGIFFRKCERNNRRGGAGSHGSEVAQIGSERLPANAVRIIYADSKIDTIGEGIDRGNDVLSARGRDQGGVVAQTERRVTVRWYVLAEPAGEFEFHPPNLTRGGGGSHWMRICRE